MVRFKSSEDGANLRNKTIRCIISPELLILIKIFQPYRITAKRKRYGDYQTNAEERKTCSRGQEAPVRHP